MNSVRYNHLLSNSITELTEVPATLVQNIQIQDHSIMSLNDTPYSQVSSHS